MASVFVVGASGYIGLGVATAFRRAGMPTNYQYVNILWLKYISIQFQTKINVRLESFWISSLRRKGD